MSNQTEFNQRHRLFLLKVSACFLALLVGSFISAPRASMQDEPETGAANVPVVVNNNSAMTGNYRPTPEPPKSTVRGRVFYEDTGRAVRRASVMLMSKSPGGGGGREVSGLTDNNGFFQIKNVGAGTYYAFINAPGVVSPLAFADFTKPRNEGLDEAVEGFTPIVVSGVGDLDVQIPARRGGAISGRVMYADGDAVIGAKVEIMRRVEKRYVGVIPNFSAIFSMMMGGGGGGFQTDDRGFYRFSGLPAGDYIVKVSENVAHSESKTGGGYSPFDEALLGGNSLLTMFYPDAFTTEKAQPVSVLAGQEQSEINITIPDRDLYAVAGKVVSAKDKSPIKNAKVQIKRVGDNTASIFDELGRRQQGGASDEEGNWNFKELPKGTYTLIIEPPYAGSYQDDPEANMNMSGVSAGNQNRKTNQPPKFKLAKKIQEIVVEDENLSEVVIELSYGATLSGTISFDNPQDLPSMISVTAEADDGKFSESATANFSYTNTGKLIPRKSADFKIEGIPTGKAFLSVNGGRGYGEEKEPEFYVKSITLGGKDISNIPFETKEGEEIKTVQIVLSKDVGKLKGKVARADKSPAAGAKLSLIPVDKQKWGNLNTRYFATTDNSGDFEITGAPGEYFVIFYNEPEYVEDGKSWIEQRREWLEKQTADAAKAIIKAKETGTISLALPE